MDLELNGDLYISGTNKKLGNLIIESGSNANGSWVKYEDGTMIITQSYTTTITSWSTWGNCYSTALNVPPNFPVSFVGTPKVTQTLECLSYNGWLATRTEAGATSSSTRAAAMQVVRPTTGGTNIPYTVNIIAIGKWK